MSGFDAIEALNREWLSPKHPQYLQVKKPTQVGETTTAIIVALEDGKTIAVLEPINEILDKTIPEAVKLAGRSEADYGIISRNEVMCLISKPDSLFGWNTKGNCKKCDKGYLCKYMEIKRNNPDCIGSTYAKFYTMVETKTDFSNALLDMLIDRDIIVLDEIATTLINTQSFDATMLSEAFGGMQVTKKEQLMAHVTLNDVLDTFVSIKTKPEKIVDNPLVLDFNEVRTYGLALIGLLHDDEVKKEFRKFLLALTEKKLVKISAKGTQFYPKKEQVRIAPVKPTFVELFLNELTARGFKGKLLITGAKMPDTKYFTNIQEVIMPDFNETEKQRLVVVDKANWYFQGDWDKQKHRVKAILDILLNITNKTEKILVVAISSPIALEIESWYAKTPMQQKLSVEEYYFTYYRKDTLGLKMPYRVGVYVGMPWKPEDALRENDIIYGERKGTFNKLEFGDVLKNALGRGKDSTGEERSIAFMLGGKLEDLNKFFPEKKEVVEVYNPATMHQVAATMAGLWLNKGQYAAKCKIDDYGVLPMVAESFNHAGYRGNLANFAKQTLRISADEYKKLFDDYNYLFPKHWKISSSGRGYIIET